MRVALTGTPGTGKTTVADVLAADPDVDLEVVHLNEVVRREDLVEGTDADRGSLIADLDAVRAHLAERDDVVVESHLAHHLEADRVVVLRCDPRELEARLRERGADEPKATENAEAEALDVVLAEAVEAHGLEAVYEVDTTGRTPESVAAAVVAVVAGEREPTAGTVDFTDYL